MSSCGGRCPECDSQCMRPLGHEGSCECPRCGDMSILILPRVDAIANFEDIMAFQYGNNEESEAAFKRLKEKSK